MIQYIKEGDHFCRLLEVGPYNLIRHYLTMLKSGWDCKDLSQVGGEMSMMFQLSHTDEFRQLLRIMSCRFRHRRDRPAISTEKRLKIEVRELRESTRVVHTIKKERVRI